MSKILDDLQNNYLKKTRKLLINLINKYDIPSAHYLKDFSFTEGKLLRPTFYFLFRNNNNKITYQDYQIAMSLEMLHMSTLIHDDIIDDSDMRRGISSLQSKFGKDVAVYSGDYLITLFLTLLSSTKDIKLIQSNISTMRHILQGELNQKAIRYHIPMDLVSYYYSIYGKTAALFALSCYEGAYLNNWDVKKCTIAKKIGYHIGVAFQIYDDILDYHISDSYTPQKPMFNDISEGVYTLPLILLYKKIPQKLSHYLYHNKEKLISEENLMTIVNLINDYNVIDESKKIANSYIHKAMIETEQLANSKYLQEGILEVFTKLKYKI